MKQIVYSFINSIFIFVLIVFPFLSASALLSFNEKNTQEIPNIYISSHVIVAAPLQVNDVLPIIEIVDTSNFSKKEDMTIFYFRHIRPTLADFNPSYKPTVKRKK